MQGGVSDTSYIDSDNNKEPVKLYEGGAGTSKADASKADTSKAETKRNKTAKTLAKEAAESAKESAKEALASAKKAETIFKELDKEVEAEEQTMKSKTAVTKSKKDGSEREVIYIRYDDINMKYVYLCVHCDTTWKTDNRM
jgi:rubrerythrin